MKMDLLTQAKGSPKHAPANLSEHQLAGVVDAIDSTMAQLEDADDVVRPGRYASNDKKADDAGDHAQDVKDGRDGKDTEPDLSLHHQRNCLDPSAVAIVRSIFCDFSKDGILNGASACAAGGRVDMGWIDVQIMPLLIHDAVFFVLAELIHGDWDASGDLKNRERPVMMSVAD